MGWAAVFGASALLAGFSSQADGRRDSPVNGSQQRLCKLLTLNEKGQRVAKRVGRAPTHAGSNVPDKSIHLHCGK